MPEQTETQPVGEIVESAIGSLAYLALHVSDAQATCENVAEALALNPNVAPEFVELLERVAGFEVRL